MAMLAFCTGVVLAGGGDDKKAASTEKKSKCCASKEKSSCGSKTSAEKEVKGGKIEEPVKAQDKKAAL